MKQRTGSHIFWVMIGSLATMLTLSCSPTMAQDKRFLTLYFDVNATLPDTVSIRQLRQAVQECAASLQRVEIIGHTDSTGSYAYNLALSQKRAQSIKMLLKDNGVDSNRITVVHGSSFSQPAVYSKGKSDPNSALNRRVRVVLINQPPKEKVKTGSINNLSAMKVGECLRLNNLNFFPGSHLLVQASRPVLDSLSGLMKRNPGLRIRIEGYICCTPPDGADGLDKDTRKMNLSEARAQTVYNALIARGISQTRLEYVGMAGRNPVVEVEKTEDDRQANRRVEIRILKR